MSPERDNERPGDAYPSRSMAWFALSEVALIWMGALVGPMLVATAVVSAVWGLAVGVIVGLGCLILLLVFAVLFRHSRQLRQWSLPRHGRQAGEPARVLVVASEATVDPLLMREIKFRAHELDTEFFVLTPILDKPFEHWVGGGDQDRHVAEHYLRTLLDQLHALGIHADGSVGTNEPLSSIESALQQFPADEVLIATHPLDKQAWLEHGLAAKIRARSDLPITHLLPVGARNAVSPSTDKTAANSAGRSGLGRQAL